MTAAEPVSSLERQYQLVFDRIVRGDNTLNKQTSIALERARFAGDRRAELTAALLRAVVLFQQRSAEDPAPITKYALDLAVELHEEEAIGRLQFIRADELFFNEHRSDEAIALLEQSMEIARRGGFKRLLADDKLTRGEYAERDGQGPVALEFLTQSFDLYSDLGGKLGMAYALREIARVHRAPSEHTKVNLEESKRLLDKASDLIDVERYPLESAMNFEDRANIEEDLNQLDNAQASWQRCLDIADKFDLKEMAAMARAQIGKFLSDQGRHAEAITMASQALKSQLTMQPITRGRALMTLAQAYASLHQPDIAMLRLTEAQQYYKKTDSARFDVEYHSRAASVRAALGDYIGANEELRALISAEVLAAKAADEQEMLRLSVQFESKLKDRSNALLRARADAVEAKRASELMAALSGFLLLGTGTFFWSRGIRRTNSTLRSLSDTGRRITFGLNLNAAVAAAEHSLRALIRPAEVSVWTLVDKDWREVPSDGSLEAQHQVFYSQIRKCAETAAEIRFPLEHVLKLNSDSSHSRFWSFHRPECILEPVSINEEVIGVLCVVRRNGRRHRRIERQIVRAVSLYLAIAIANIRAASALSVSNVELEKARTRNMLAQSAHLVTIGTMATSVIHEMTHPVGAMTLQAGNARAYLSRGLTEFLDESISHIHREADRLQHLISRLRNIARSEPPNLKVVSLIRILEDARILVQPRAKMESVEYVEVRPIPDINIRADFERIVLAIANIVFNAMDAMAEMSGGAAKRIYVRVTVTPSDVLIGIRDTGPGINQDARDRLFEPFFTTKAPGKGLGLGLALSLQSVSSSNGTIDVESPPGGGAEFTLKFPVVLFETQDDYKGNFNFSCCTESRKAAASPPN